MENSFKETVQAMTGKEIVMAMVNGLRKKHVKINMMSYGHKDDGVCYGCAATNAICEILGRVPEMGEWARGEDYSVIRKRSIDATDVHFVALFESSIDDLRSACFDMYNNGASALGLPKLPEPAFELPLPYLSNDYTEEDLQKWEDYANTL